MRLFRAELIEQVLASTVAAIVGPAGAGKSDLARQAALVSGRTTVRVELERAEAGVEALASAVAAGLRSAGVAGGDTTDLTWLLQQDEPLVVIVDDVHDLTDEAAEALASALSRMPDRHRLVMTGRSLHPRLAAVVDGVVGEDALRLRGADLGQLAVQAGVTPDPATLQRVDAASNGWIGGAVLVLGRVAAGDIADGDGAGGLLRRAVGALVDPLAPQERTVAAVLAHLPRLLDGIDAGLGAPGLLDRLLASGAPLTRNGAGVWSMPDWIREQLAAAAPAAFDVAAAVRVSAWYRESGDPIEAVAVLLDVGEVEAAVALLRDLREAEVDRLDLVDVDALVARLPHVAVAAAPQIELLLARLCADAVLMVRRTELLDRLWARLDDLDPRTAAEVRAERARDLMRDGEAEAASQLAEEILAGAGPDDLRARAVACEVRGRAAAWFSSGEAALADARSWLDRALALARRLGSADLESAVLAVRAYRVDFFGGRLADAAAGLEAAAGAIASRPRRRAMLLTFLAEVEHHRGRFAEAAAALDETRVVATALGDDRLHAYVAWERARGAGWQGRAAELDACIAEVERRAADWWEHPSGMVFLAEMADLLDRGGDAVRARAFLDRAMQRMAGLGFDDPDVLLVAAAIEARHGDAALAQDLLDRVDATEALPPSRRWRPMLLRALVASRAGDPVAARLAVAAFEEAGRLGLGDLPMRQEPEATAALAALAAAAGSPVAADIAADVGEVSVSVLGRFEVAHAGVPLDVPAGQPAQVVKLVAALGGRARVEVVIDALWPEASETAGRKLLRNVLTRLRRIGTELLVRDGDVLSFAANVSVDAVGFEESAARALAVAGIDDAAAAAVGRLAVARYRGDLLPEDLYEDWAAAPRERLRHRLVVLLGLLAEVAAAAGRVDEAARYLERAIAAEPLEVDHYEQLARLFERAGRANAAVATRARGLRMVEQLGI